MREVDLSSFTNNEFEPGAFLKRIIWYILSVLIFKSTWPWPSRYKVAVLRFFGANVGEGVVLKPSVSIKYPWFLSIGDNVWIGEKVWIDNLVEVQIASNTCISQGAMLLTGNHNFTKSTFDLMARPIYLEKGVWIGAQSIVCPGVTCFTHAVLSVGSVATKDLDPYCIYSGNPAVKTKTRNIIES